MSLPKNPLRIGTAALALARHCPTQARVDVAWKYLGLAHLPPEEYEPLRIELNDLRKRACVREVSHIAQMFDSRPPWPEEVRRLEDAMKGADWYPFSPDQVSQLYQQAYLREAKSLYDEARRRPSLNLFSLIQEKLQEAALDGAAVESHVGEWDELLAQAV